MRVVLVICVVLVAVATLSSVCEARTTALDKVFGARARHRARLDKVTNVRMMTVGEPCPYTQSAFGWFIEKNPGHEPTLNVAFAYPAKHQADGGTGVDITAWQKDVRFHSGSYIHHVESGQDVSGWATSQRQAPNQIRTALEAHQSLRDDARTQLALCFDWLEKRGTVNKQEHVAASLQVIGKTAPASAHCVRACMYSMIVENSIPSCSIAVITRSDGKGGVETFKRMAHSAARGAHVAVPFWLQFHPSSTAAAPLDPRSLLFASMDDVVWTTTTGMDPTVQTAFSTAHLQRWRTNTNPQLGDLPVGDQDPSQDHGDRVGVCSEDRIVQDIVDNIGL